MKLETMKNKKRRSYEQSELTADLLEEGNESDENIEEEYDQDDQK